jgi:hypothetical protein
MDGDVERGVGLVEAAETDVEGRLGPLGAMDDLVMAGDPVARGGEDLEWGAAVQVVAEQRRVRAVTAVVEEAGTVSGGEVEPGLSQGGEARSCVVAVGVVVGDA